MIKQPSSTFLSTGCMDSSSVVSLWSDKNSRILQNLGETNPGKAPGVASPTRTPRNPYPASRVTENRWDPPDSKLKNVPDR